MKEGSSLGISNFYARHTFGLYCLLVSVSIPLWCKNHKTNSSSVGLRTVSHASTLREPANTNPARAATSAPPSTSGIEPPHLAPWPTVRRETPVCAVARPLPARTLCDAAGTVADACTKTTPSLASAPAPRTAIVVVPLDSTVGGVVLAVAPHDDANTSASRIGVNLTAFLAIPCAVSHGRSSTVWSGPQAVPHESPHVTPQKLTPAPKRPLQRRCRKRSHRSPWRYRLESSSRSARTQAPPQ